MQVSFDINKLKTPYYIVDKRLLRKNLEILKAVSERTTGKILLAQKAFSMFSLYPFIAQYQDGTTASGLFEARLGYTKMGKENHVFCPAYKEEEFEEICRICDHIIFNSIGQLEKFRDIALSHEREIGLRINPEFSTQNHGIYDPCAYGSRLGVTIKNFDESKLRGVSGLHFHTLCEQNSHDLVKTLSVVEEKFGKYIYNMKWVNFGGGHHITRSDYDIEVLVGAINRFREKYNVEVYLEPGEAVVLNAGFLVSEVVDIIDNGVKIAIMDTSAACHMPDVLEMPYRPHIINSGDSGEKQYTYRLGGPTCLAGDIIGDYSFDNPLEIGARLIFCDMAHYSMVKNNTFNGICLPSIAIALENGEIQLVKSFGYLDFEQRLS